MRLLASPGLFSCAPRPDAPRGASESAHFLGRSAMKTEHASGRHLLQTGERFLGHTIAVLVGLMLMIVGLALGVTMVALPIGIPVGLGGLLLFIWGLCFAAPRTQT